MKLHQFGIATLHPFDPERIEKDGFINSVGKPTGGIWLSPVTDNQSEWERFCAEELEGRLRYTYVYNVELTFEGIKVFHAPPSIKELEKVMDNTACAGFYLKGIHPKWDVQSLWLKDDRNILSMKEKGSRGYETA